MGKTDAADLELVTKGLTDLGLCVSPVAEGSTKTADLLAQIDSHRYLIEVKARHDDEFADDKLLKGNLLKVSLSLNHSSQIDEKARNASKQLESDLPADPAAAPPPPIRLLAFVNRSEKFGEESESQIFGSLYGTRDILDFAAPHPCELRTCLYFAESIFFRHRRSIDGAIVISRGEWYICLNDHAANKDRTKASPLFQSLMKQGRVNSVSVLEDSGFLVADCDLDRKHEKLVLDYLAKKYTLKQPIALDMKVHSAMILKSRAQK